MYTSERYRWANETLDENVNVLNERGTRKVCERHVRNVYRAAVPTWTLEVCSAGLLSYKSKDKEILMIPFFSLIFYLGSPKNEINKCLTLGRLGRLRKE